MERYRELRVIGKGSFGMAVLAQHRETGEEVVVKKVDIRALDEEGRKSSRREATILNALHHPSIIKHFESFEEDGKLCIVTEYAAGGDLSHVLDKAKADGGALIPEERILQLAVELFCTLNFLHSRKILHRDIKLQNIFISEDSGIRLGDFGIARILKHTFENARSIVGTPYYISPELAANKPYNAKSDVWACGCVLYELCAQRHAFEASSIPELVRKILRGRFTPIPSSYSDDLRALISLMLSHSPAARPPISAILQLPFLQPVVEAYVRRCSVREFPLPRLSLPEEMRHLVGEGGGGGGRKGGGMAAAMLMAAKRRGSATPIPHSRGTGRRHESRRPRPGPVSVLRDPAFIPPSHYLGKKAEGGGGEVGTVIEHPTPHAVEEDEGGRKRRMESTQAFVRHVRDHDIGIFEGEGDGEIGVKLDGVSTLADPLTHRLEALRAHLADELGTETLLLLYNAITTATTLEEFAHDIGAVIRKQLATTDKLSLAPLVEQLVDLEKIAFTMPVSSSAS